MDMDRIFFIPRPDRLFRQFQSIRSKPEIGDADLDNLLADYDLHLLIKPTVPKGRGRSGTLLLKTDMGWKILKKYKSTVTDSMIDHEHSILQHLVDTKIPIPRLFISAKGNTSISIGLNKYALFDFIDKGYHYHNYILSPGRERKYISISGVMLANIHNELASFIPKGNNPNGFLSQTEQRERNLNWYLQILDHIKQQDNKIQKQEDQEIIQDFLDNAEPVEESLSDLEQQLNKADLPKQIIHGDYGPYNLLINAEKIIAVLDFEVARLDWRDNRPGVCVSQVYGNQARVSNQKNSQPSKCLQ